MSREEAIEIINRENDPNDKKVWELFPEYREALDMAIQALSQEPCEDAVSREELLKAIETWDKFGCDADTKLVPYKDHYIPYIHYDDVIKAIKGMPSVTPSRHKGQGHWKEPKNPYDIDGTYYCYCSECECDANEQTDFCPNCGAEMESK